MFRLKIGIILSLVMAMILIINLGVHLITDDSPTSTEVDYDKVTDSSPESLPTKFVSPTKIEPSETTEEHVETSDPYIEYVKKPAKTTPEFQSEKNLINEEEGPDELEIQSISVQDEQNLNDMNDDNQEDLFNSQPESDFDTLENVINLKKPNSKIQNEQDTAGGSWVESFEDKPWFGNMTSAPIKVPYGMHWDTLIFNDTKPRNTYVNVTILNPINDTQIPGTPKYSSDGEFDISYIDSIKYPSIKLRAELTKNLTAAPILNYWGVSWNTTNAWRDTLFGGLKGTSQDLTRGNGELWLPTSFTDWYKYSKNPILKVGSGSSWDNSILTSPVVVYNGSEYMMWYAGGGTQFQIGLATSKDGIKWTKYSGNPVITPGPTNSWEDEHVKPCCVLFDGKTYRMWYRGMNKNTTDWNTGFATSLDGINWKKHANNPVLLTGSSPSNWDSHFAILDDIYFNGIEYEGWYTGLAAMIPNKKAPYQIGYATSNDGINWSKYSKNPVLSDLQGWYTGINGFFVIINNGQYFGYYNYKPTGGSPINIHYATSNDGINWIKYSKNPVLDRGATGAWDDTTAVAPEIILKDKQYYMYYRGSDSSFLQIGLAKSKFGPEGSIKSTIINLPKYQVFDQLILNKTEPKDTFVNVSIIDAKTNQYIASFSELRGNTINISDLNLQGYTSIRLIANFSSNEKSTPILYNWAVTWRPLPELEVTAGLYTGVECTPVQLKATCPISDYVLKLEYRWDINDDRLFDTPWSSSATYSHTWHDDHKGRVNVELRDNFGRTTFNDGLVIVNNLAPIVSAGQNQKIYEGQKAIFNGTYSDPGIQDTHTITWDFGDGLNRTGKLNTSHGYFIPGTYNITLTVIDDDGGMGIDNLTLTVINIAPWVDAGEDILVDEGESFTFNASIKNPGFDNLSLSWDFDIETDGPDADNNTDNDNDSKVLNPTHFYLDNGTYYAKLTVGGDECIIVYGYVKICVFDLKPIANFSWSPEPQKEGSPVQFTDTSYSYPDEIVSWHWEFGDGNTSSKQNPTHAYADNGVYPVSLTVTDEDGSQDMISYKITIINVAPTAEAGENKSGFEADTFKFTGSCFDPGINDTHTYEWDFDYDGSLFNVDATGQIVKNTWIDDFKGYVAVRVTDDDGGVGIDTCYVLVKNVAPSISLEILPVDVNISLRITGEKWHDVTLEVYENNVMIVTGNLTRYPGCPNTQTLNLSTLKVNISRMYQAIIRYTPDNDPVNGQPNGANPCWIILYYEDEQGGQRKKHTFNVKQVSTHVWKVNLSKDLHIKTLSFQGKGFDPGADDLTFYWSLGDGTNVTNFYPNKSQTYPVKILDVVKHTYKNTGTFTVTLTVKDDDGGVASAKVTFTLK